ncbi:hypothetical protein Q7P37_004075 [Cladosporium fusiforme]
MPKRNIWRSKRLLYRPTETTDEPFLQSLNDTTSESYQQATFFLPVPQGQAGARKHREFLQSALLGCIVCLPAPAPSSASASATTPSEQLPSAPIPIGTISLLAPDPLRAHHRNTTIGVNVASPYQGQGYGSEAILWVLDWAFRHANMHRVGISAHAWNEGAVRLYQRLGFVLEGRQREVMWYDGAWHDGVDMAMLEGEWRERYWKNGGEGEGEGGGRK